MGFPKTFEVLVRVILSEHTAIKLGTMCGRWCIVHTMGSTITRLKPRDGFCAETAAATAIMLPTWAGAGVSTMHVITGSITGVGCRQRIKAVRQGVAMQIVWAWLLTIPAAAAVSAACYAMRRAADLTGR